MVCCGVLYCGVVCCGVVCCGVVLCTFKLTSKHYLCFALLLAFLCTCIDHLCFANDHHVSVDYNSPTIIVPCRLVFMGGKIA